jgi:hypothetical protein
VTARGDERKNIFRDQRDREQSEELLVEVEAPLRYGGACACADGQPPPPVAEDEAGDGVGCAASAGELQRLI